jgi:predicted lipoprotein
MKRLIAITILLVSALPAHADVPPVTRAIDGFIRPAYGHFHQATVTLEADIDDLCAEPSSANLAAARTDFVDTVQFWSEVEPIRFGPVTEKNRLERILFWPDRKSIGLKQVQGALADKDPTATDPATLAGKSVAMQGLGALEFVLFGTGAEELETTKGEFRCSYANAIAANLQVMASDISAAWNAPDGIAKQLANPAADNPLYRTETEAVTEIFDVLVHGLELVRDVRINGFLGDDAKADKPKQAIFWRSEATVISIAANLNGLEKLFDAADFSPSLSADMAWIPGSIDFEFRNAENALGELTGPVADILADDAKRQKLAYAKLVTSSLSEIFGVRLAAALGLSAGFSSLDGD